MKADRFTTLDIGADQVRIGVFERHAAGQLEMLDYGVEPYASDAASVMAHDAVVATALKRLMDRMSPTVRKVSMAVEGQSVFSRLVKLPPVSDDQLVQTIRHEAVQNIPFPIGDVVWDYHIIDPSASEPEVLLVAVKCELLNGLVHAVEANGLTVEMVDVAPAALANAVRFNYSELDGTTLLVDAGTHSSNLVLMEGDKFFFRSLPVDGGMTSRLQQEIDRSITFFRNQQGGNSPNRILITGTIGPNAELSERFEVPVERFEPLRRIKTASNISDDGSLGVVVGLAARREAVKAIEINLVPESLQSEQRMRHRLPLMAACGAVALATVLVWILGVWSMTDITRREATQLAAHIHGLEQVEAKMVPLEKKLSELTRRRDAYRRIQQQRTLWINNLTVLKQLMPEGMFLLASEPLQGQGEVDGLRVTVVSYLDKEPVGEDAVIALRDRLRASSTFNNETKVFKRPAKGLFARQFVLDVYFEEPMP